MTHSSKEHGMNAGPKPGLMIAAASPLPVCLDSRELFRGGNEVLLCTRARNTACA